MRQRLRDWITGTTVIVIIPEDLFDTGDPCGIPCVACCGIGPITTDYIYCPRCGKRILRG
jgi:hypothetical protein